MSLMPFLHYPLSSEVIGSIDFERSNSEYVASTTNVASIGTGDFCLECWVKPESLLFSNYVMTIGGTSTADNGAVIFITSSGKLRAIIDGSSSATTENTTNSVGLGAWHHVAIVRESETVYVFVDGEKSNSYSENASIDANPIALGSGRASTYSNGFDGKVALARWSNTARYTASFTPEIDYGPDGDTIAFVTSNGVTISETAGGLTLTEYNSPTPDADAPS